jgi:hypothetical protein
MVAIVSATLIPSQALAQSSGTVSYRVPDSMILSTGNLYFTSHDAASASVWRTGQDSTPGQESLLYKEFGARFGDLVYAQVDGTWWGYFLATKAGVTTIRRVSLTGGAAIVLGPPVTEVDIVKSHRNLVTDGVSLYWQDAYAVRKMPIRGGASTVLDWATPSATTGTAGLAMQPGYLVYASGNAIRYVPTSGDNFTSPSQRTIVTASSRVTTLAAQAGGIFWGEQGGAVRAKLGATFTTLQWPGGMVPTSISTSGAARVWTQCNAQACTLGFQYFSGVSEYIGTGALGASGTSAGTSFWGDAAGVHRRLF